MRIDMYATHQGIRSIDLRGKTVVVIDVLRTASTIATALSEGCREVVSVSDVESAMSVLQRYGRSGALLGGVRGEERIAGFDLGNSPLEYNQSRVEGKVLIYTSGNGTDAIEKAKEARRLYLGSFLNVTPLAAALAGEQDVILLCAGTNERFSMDDVLAGGCIIKALTRYADVQLDDLGLMAYHAYIREDTDLMQRLSGTHVYRQLMELGYEADLQYCLKVDALSNVPVFRDNVFVNYLN